MRHHGRAVGAANVEDEAAAGDAQVQLEWAARAADRRERVRFQEIVNGDRALVLDIRARAADRSLVERHRDKAARFCCSGGWLTGHRGLKRSATERACAWSPSASPSAIAAGPSE